MIAHISGTIIAQTDKYIVVETGGIGYQVFVTAETLVKQKVGDTVGLWTTHIVREEVSDLYGFENTSDQILFELLLSVSGIGPRSALGVMNVATIGTIARAVNTNDVGYLTKISGIGRKTAEKIILELRDKLPGLDSHDHDPTSHDVIDALVALGYSETSARDTLRNLDKDVTDTQSMIREALKLLNGN